MTIWILPLYADQKKASYRALGVRNFYDVPGPVSRRIGRVAARLLPEFPAAYLCPCASARYGSGKTGKELMEIFFENTCGVRPSAIAHVDTKGVPFRTVGEMQAFTRMLTHNRSCRDATAPSPRDTIYIVGRWWHLPRAKALLRKQLGTLAETVEIKAVAMSSWEGLNIAREFLLAWPKNMLLGDV